MAIPDRHILACDSSFMTSGKLNRKIVKLKETALENVEQISENDKAINHDRKCTEWCNNLLAVVFRRLCVKMPTDNNVYKT